MPIDDTKKAVNHVRIVAYVPLVMAVAAGAICTGTGIGTAAPATSAHHELENRPGYEWQLINRTGAPISGNWSVSDHGETSRVERRQNEPWMIDEIATAAQKGDYEGARWQGAICYRTNWWKFAPRVAHAHWFRLEADSTGALFVYYQPDDRAGEGLTAQPVYKDSLRKDGTC
ncbi:hypothetical protein R3Q06_34615 [Rhodococcus erythropolis]|uniref:hypothetical protein n=1 Tax=Rhodococcus erythropolis TaxID=1833 RepID=UPI00294A0007|nr:hypothetical protein [Rhodococcus erythropolis]MDV6278535.1 hypothetical protein [Rhodococcus erythropolis]